jgi:hypothetical protein
MSAAVSIAKIPQCFSPSQRDKSAFLEKSIGYNARWMKRLKADLEGFAAEGVS